MQIELLGTGGYHPSDRRHTACVLVAECGLVLDAGTGAYRLIERLTAEPPPDGRLDVVLTHAHLDHVVGLTYLTSLEPGGRPLEIVVHAAAPVIEAVRDHLLAEALFPINPVARFEPLGERLALPSGPTLTTFPLDHPGGSLGVRVERGGKSFAYVTDTRAVSAATVAHFRGVDLLMHEANFADAQEGFAELTGHSTAAQAARTARDAQVDRLVMVHIDPRATPAAEAIALAEAQAVFLAAEFGRDGMRITL